MQRRSCSGDSSGRKRRSRRSFLARRRGEAVSGTACVTPAWPRQRLDAVGNGRGGEGKQQLVGKGGKISRRRQGGRRWRPYPPRGACSSVAGEVGSAGTRLGRARGRVNREDDRGGRWAGPGRVGRGPGGGQGLFHPFAFPFPLFLFILSYFILVTFYFSLVKIITNT